MQSNGINVRKPLTLPKFFSKLRTLSYFLNPLKQKFYPLIISRTLINQYVLHQISPKSLIIIHIKYLNSSPFQQLIIILNLETDPLKLWPQLEQNTSDVSRLRQNFNNFMLYFIEAVNKVT